LRRTANRTADPRPGCSRGELVLHHRVLAVRTDLNEIPSLLERAHDPDPMWIASLHDLLANGCDGPLYNIDIDESELRATLYYARAALLGHAEHNQPRVR
jgi:hypothetical protein